MKIANKIKHSLKLKLRLRNMIPQMRIMIVMIRMINLQEEFQAKIKILTMPNDIRQESNIYNMLEIYQKNTHKKLIQNSLNKSNNNSVNPDIKRVTLVINNFTRTIYNNLQGQIEIQQTILMFLEFREKLVNYLHRRTMNQKHVLPTKLGLLSKRQKINNSF